MKKVIVQDERILSVTVYPDIQELIVAAKNGTAAKQIVEIIKKQCNLA